MLLRSPPSLIPQVVPAPETLSPPRLLSEWNGLDESELLSGMPAQEIESNSPPSTGVYAVLVFTVTGEVVFTVMSPSADPVCRVTSPVDVNVRAPVAAVQV